MVLFLIHFTQRHFSQTIINAFFKRRANAMDLYPQGVRLQMVPECQFFSKADCWLILLVVKQNQFSIGRRQLRQTLLQTLVFCILLVQLINYFRSAQLVRIFEVNTRVLSSGNLVGQSFSNRVEVERRISFIFRHNFRQFTEYATDYFVS